MNFIKKLTLTLTLIFVLTASPSFCNDDIKLVPVGDVVYIHSCLKTPTVQQVLSNSAKKLQPKDVLLSVDCNSGKKASSVEDIHNIMKLQNEDIEVSFIRNGKNKKISMSSDELRLYELSTISGCIGTITAVDKNGNFVGLSHSLGFTKNNAQFNKIGIFETSFIQQRKSLKDDIGFLVASNIGDCIGRITSINNYGVKGSYKKFKFDSKKALSIADPQPGQAYILCSDSITNEPKLHEIVITEVGEHFSSIKIVDPSLIKFRGGIVKGMSGSPVIQNDKIVGGVRSTKTNNPKEGHITNIDSMIGIEIK